MASIPLKPQYGPTLGKLLEPRWRSATLTARVLTVAALLGLLAVAIGVALALLDSSYSQGGRVPFSFKYRGLYRTATEPGDYVTLVRTSHGLLDDSFSVAPLALPPYRGQASGELPLFASGYTAALARRFPRFRLEGEGKTRISSTLSGYDVLYSALVDGRTMYGRNVMLLPGGHGVRKGVVLEMLSSEPATISLPVASSGVLETPLKTFSFG
ncbi:MAG TPA: hypothetical protein VN845_09305 [Solirubrobacteraceae bacterium]|nr:hypothetical protein [Solirubrobacteraceae bacterium]